jgi:hypothetical protein
MTNIFIDSVRYLILTAVSRPCHQPRPALIIAAGRLLPGPLRSNLFGFDGVVSACAGGRRRGLHGLLSGVVQHPARSSALQPKVSNRAIADVLGVAPDTIDRAARNQAGGGQKAKGNRKGGARNQAGAKGGRRDAAKIAACALHAVAYLRQTTRASR